MVSLHVNKLLKTLGELNKYNYYLFAIFPWTSKINLEEGEKRESLYRT